MVIKTSDLIWQDVQHQRLFYLFDEMKEEIFDHSILVELEVYAAQHFSLEEAYMVELDYPETNEHITAHDRFREELVKLTDIPQPISPELRASLAMFLEQWLTSHILAVDKKLEEFVLGSSQK